MTHIWWGNDSICIRNLTIASLLCWTYCRNLLQRWRKLQRLYYTYLWRNLDWACLHAILIVCVKLHDHSTVLEIYQNSSNEFLESKEILKHVFIEIKYVWQVNKLDLNLSKTILEKWWKYHLRIWKNLTHVPENIIRISFLFENMQWGNSCSSVCLHNLAVHHHFIDENVRLFNVEHYLMAQLRIKMMEKDAVDRFKTTSMSNRSAYF